MKKSILSANEAQTIAEAIQNGCELAQTIASAIKGEVINPDSWSKRSSSEEVSRIMFRVKDAYNEDLKHKYGTTKDRNTEFKGFKDGLKHIAAVRKILMLDIKTETGKTNVLTVSLMKQIEKIIEQKTKSLPLCDIVNRPILTTDINGKAIQYMERNVFALTGNLNFIEALKQTQNGNGYNVTLLRNLYERFNSLPFSEHENVYGKAYELNSIFNKSELKKEHFSHVCNLFGFDVNDSETFATFAGMGQKVLAKLTLQFYPYYFAKNYSKFAEAFKDSKGEKPGTAFSRFVTDTLDFSSLDSFLDTIKSAKVTQTLSEVCASKIDAKKGEIESTPKVDKAASKEAEAKAKAEAKAEAEDKEAKLADLLNLRENFILQREKLAKSIAKNKAQKLAELDATEAQIQAELNELQGLNTPLNPAKVYAA